MKNWADTAAAIIRAELPDFEPTRAFSTLLQVDAPSEQEEAAAGTCLSKLLDLDKAALTSQVRRAKPLAAALQAKTGAGQLDSWAHAALKLEKSREDVTELKQTVMRARAWGLSTSGVERTQQ
ncbi:unnamed protein product, partial [Effrenium voratum]